MFTISLSIRRYALVFGAFVFILCVLLGVLGYQQYRSAVNGIERLELQAARDELNSALINTLEDLRTEADALSDWDELFLQLANPAYYAYWHAYRVQNGTSLGPRFLDLMLYGPDGAALANLQDSGLPARVAPGQLQERFVPVDGDVHMILLRRLQRLGDERVHGYLALRAPLLPGMLRLSGFSRVDPGSLRFRLEQESGDVAAVESSLAYEPVPTTRRATMDSLVRRLLLLLAIAALVPTLILMFFFNRHLGRSVEELSRVVQTLRSHGVKGAQQILERTGRLRIRELEVTEQLLIDYQRELLSANARLDEKNRELWDLAHRDSLTGAQNRRAFDTFWQTLQAMNERKPRSLRLMLCDVNRFKSINDTYGHDIGDAVLQAIVQCLHRAIRREEQLFRLGGDEFACVLIDCDDKQALLVASRCEREVANYPFTYELGLREPVRLSIGISPAAESSSTSVKVPLRQADVAMYHSKRPASGSVCIYREAMESVSGAIFSSSINEAVYRVVEQGEGLIMHYQLVRHSETGGPSYYEALMRIDHGDRLIQPAEIMPIVESRHLEKELDQAVIEQLLKDLYDSTLPVGTGVSINLSAVSISDPDIIGRLEPFRHFMSDYKLVLEVTETALITQMESANSHLAELRARGFLVALDDFGSGYSSLSYLTSMPVDIVKFDISLIRSLDDDPHRRLVAHLLEFISSAGQETVAEGVEDVAALQRVRDLGFDYVQGFLHGEPELLSPLPRISALR